VIELLKTIAMLCSINMGTGIDNKFYSEELLKTQYGCQARLARCVKMNRSKGEDGNVLLNCVSGE
jgi:hypothetical protein